MSSHCHEPPAPPLAGVIVVDLTRYVSGPYCTMLLADAGATVIKVEPPEGEPTRHGTPRVGPGGEAAATFVRMNRGKKSVALDLKTEAGRDAMRRLVAGADALVENFRPGVLARFGLGEDDLARINPKLIYCTITGFGHTASTWRSRPAFNLIAELEAGVYHQERPDDTPRPLGPYVGDLIPGLHALSGLTMALYRRERTGQGGRVDIAMFDSMLSFNELACSIDQASGDPASGTPGSFCPSDVYPSADGFVCLDVVTYPQWRSLCETIGHPNLAGLPDLSDGPGRAAHFDDQIAGPLLGWLATRTSETAMETLSRAGVPAAVVRAPADALRTDQATRRSMVVQVSMSPGAGLLVPANPIRMDGDPRPLTATVPRLGQDTTEILAAVAGLSPGEIAQLAKEPDNANTS